MLFNFGWIKIAITVCINESSVYEKITKPQLKRCWKLKFCSCVICNCGLVSQQQAKPGEGGNGEKFNGQWITQRSGGITRFGGGYFHLFQIFSRPVQTRQDARLLPGRKEGSTSDCIDCAGKCQQQPNVFLSRFPKTLSSGRGQQRLSRHRWLFVALNRSGCTKSYSVVDKVDLDWIHKTCVW